MRLFRERMYFCQSLLTKKIKRIMKEFRKVSLEESKK